MMGIAVQKSYGRSEFSSQAAPASDGLVCELEQKLPSLPYFVMHHYGDYIYVSLNIIEIMIIFDSLI